MKKLIAILAITAAAVFTTGCTGPEGPMGPQGLPGRDGTVSKIVIDGIFVNPTENPNGGWTELWLGSQNDRYFDCMYADIEMPELTLSVINDGFFFTYYQYNDVNTLVQEGEGLTVYNGNWSYTLNCEYSVGNMRITIRTSDFEPFIPGERMNFRTVILY